MGQTAEELLDNLTEDEIAAYTADPATEEHIVIGADRFITVPDALKRIAVQFDHDVETVTFDCPRYWDDHDMSAMRVYINYLLPDNKTKGTYIVDDVSVDETDTNIMHFTWTISREVTQLKGTVTFLVCIKKADDAGNEENHWNSELCKSLTVSEGLECAEPVIAQYPDIITDLLTRMELLEGAVDGELLDDIMLDIASINAKDTAQDESIASLSEQVSSNDSDITALQADLAGTDTDLANLAVGVATNEVAIDNLEKQVGTNTTNIEHVQAIIDSLEADGVVSDVSFTELEKRVAANEENITTNQTDISNLKVDLNTAQTDISNLQAAVENIDTNLTSIMNEETF